MPTNVPKRRSSSSVSGHRGPPWSQTQQGLQSMLTPRRVPRPLTNIDMDHVDNFSYDPQYLNDFSLPDGLDERLPDQLRREVHNWQKAGAALLTALNRTKESGKRAAEYAYPDATTHEPVWPLSRRPSAQASEGASATSSTAGLASPPAISPESLKPLDPFASASHRKQAGPPDTSMGMETPPFSPIDSGAYTSPVATATLPKTKPGSWEYFLGKFDNEVRDTKIALQRLTGYAKKIEVEKMELERDFTPEVVLVMMQFREWWKTTGPQVSKLAHQVDFLLPPRLEDLDVPVGGGFSSGSVRGKGAAAAGASGGGGEQRQ
ncbi:hypothetical protein KC353_g13341 [Hortaea werneckii]|nr:hypothetical protein KC353_g13341 [Hortaea werneckii]